MSYYYLHIAFIFISSDSYYNNSDYANILFNYFDYLFVATPAVPLTLICEERLLREIRQVEGEGYTTHMVERYFKSASTKDEELVPLSCQSVVRYGPIPDWSPYLKDPEYRLQSYRQTEESDAFMFNHQADVIDMRQYLLDNAGLKLSEVSFFLD